MEIKVKLRENLECGPAQPSFFSHISVLYIVLYKDIIQDIKLDAEIFIYPCMYVFSAQASAVYVLHLVTSGRYLVQCILGWRENVHQHTKRGKSAIQKYHNYMNSYFSPRRSYRRVPQLCMGF